MSDNGKQPTILPGPGTDKVLAQVELADIVRLKKPYQPHRESGLPEPRGPYQFGIVAEVLTVLPDGRVRNVSLYLYDTESRTIFLGPNNIPEYVDFHTSELELYKRATEQGYTPPPLPVVFSFRAYGITAESQACT